MGFGDKFKDLTQQAKDRVAENRDKIQEAVDAAAVAANEKTHGKYANKIMKVNEKTGSALDKFSSGAGTETGDEAGAGEAGDAQASASAPVAPAQQDYTPPSFADEAAAPAPSNASVTGEPSTDGPKFDD